VRADAWPSESAVSSFSCLSFGNEKLTSRCRAGKLFWDGYHVHSSLVASKAQHDDMLEFAARHNIEPTTEVFKFEGSETIEGIFSKLDSGKVRYRAVLEF